MPKADTLNGHKSAILSRAIQPAKTDLTPAVAKALLRFQLAQPDQVRVHELLAKNQDDLLTKAERDELDCFLEVGMLMDLLRAKAHATLKRAGARSGSSHE